LREKDSGNPAAANTDFGGVEFPRSLGTESLCGVGDQETQAERRKYQTLSRSETLLTVADYLIGHASSNNVGHVKALCAHTTACLNRNCLARLAPLSALISLT
jgi:hypothetical protein